MKECYFQQSYSLCNFTKSFTPPWVFFTFFKLYKWYQIQLWINFYQIFFSTTWDIVPSEISSKEQDWTPVKYLNVLNNNKTQKQLRHWTKIFYYTGKILFIIFSSKSFMANFFFEILYMPISNDSIILQENLMPKVLKSTDCLFLSCHVRVSE